MKFNLGKVKEFFIEYKWWIVAAIIGIFALMMIRPKSGTSTTTEYTTSSGGQTGVAPDPTLMLAQLQAQTQLGLQAGQLQAQLNQQQIVADLTRYQTDASTSIGMATIDANKWLGQLDSTTQLGLAGLQTDATKYVANAGVQTAQIQADVENRAIDAQKYIAGQQIKVQKRGQEYNAILGVLNWGGGFFK